MSKRDVLHKADETHSREQSLIDMDGHSNGVGPNKRRRASEDADDEFTSHRALSDTALEVDIMILDYQAYWTTNAVLNDTHDRMNSNVRSNIMNTDAFTKHFRARHVAYQADDALRLRLQLLQFTILFVGRYNSDHNFLLPDQLNSIRTHRHDRVRRWIASIARIPTKGYDISPLESMPAQSAELIQSTREHILRTLSIDLVDAQGYGKPDGISFLDLLPRFMELCALTFKLHGKLNMTITMQIMINFMLQASLEQYLVYGVSETVDPIDEAFAWGCFADAVSEESDTDDEDEPAAKYKGMNMSLSHDQAENRSHDQQSAQSKSNGTARAHVSYRTVQVLTDVERAVDNMFRNSSTGKESELWQNAKAYMLDELFHGLEHAASVSSHLHEKARSAPLHAFDADVRGFLQYCSDLIGLPVLAQLEQGQLDGMTKEETKQFLISSGASLTGSLR